MPHVTLQLPDTGMFGASTWYWHVLFKYLVLVCSVQVLGTGVFGTSTWYGYVQDKYFVLVCLVQGPGTGMFRMLSNSRIYTFNIIVTILLAIVQTS